MREEETVVKRCNENRYSNGLLNRLTKDHMNESCTDMWFYEWQGRRNAGFSLDG